VSYWESFKAAMRLSVGGWLVPLENDEMAVSM